MSHKAKKTDQRLAAHASPTASGKGRPKLPLSALLVAGAFIVIAAVVALVFSAGRSPASTAIASGSAAPTITQAAVKPTQSAPTQAASVQQEPAQDKIAVKAQDGAVKLALADVSDGKAHFYTYEGAGKTIAFFVLKGADGVIRAAFDACDVCFPAKKGYHQEGDVMVCNNCGNRFPSVKINVETGGCNPAPLADQTAGTELTIQVARLEAGAKYF